MDVSAASTSLQQWDLSPEPDLHPLYPSLTHIASLLSSNSGLSPTQRAELVGHCLARSCAFGELIILQYLLSDPYAQPHVDLGLRDEDGLGLVSLAIHGFGAESDRDVEREECVRLLIAQGADLGADKDGWTPLHHAALLSPPTLVSHLMTHGCSPFAVTRRGLTPLDVVTAHSILPGRDDVALLLEESMRGEGWTGGRMEEKRRLSEKREKRKTRRKDIRKDISQILSVNTSWWGETDSDSESDDDAEDANDEQIYTPLPDYSSMLVFSPPSLPNIFDSLITNFKPSLRDATPANTLYLLARFACLTCDHTWLEDLIIGATDTIEETFFSRAEDVTCLVFWLYNTTVWLHLLQCDTSINEACEMLGSFDLIEEVINSVFVFIIRFAERRIDHIFDSAFLDFSPQGTDFESVQFESDWSFLRPFSGKKKAPPSSVSAKTISRARTPSSPPSPGQPLSQSQSQGQIPPSSSRGFSSLRQTFGRPSSTPLSSLFPDSPPPPSPNDLTSFLTALHTLLNLSDINPAMTTQLWSQVMYWTSCEVFNRIITRKKYLCRSRSIQIGMNLAVLEEWIEQMGLPSGVRTHFFPVRDLLNWLQSLSSITEFPDLVATIQTLKHINPLQMRRAVRDYKYEVNEGRMTDECVQYLTQLQKDWERHRVKLGVEALRKEMVEKDREDSVSSYVVESSGGQTGQTPSIYTNSSDISGSHNVDVLFGTHEETQSWEPTKPPSALGELLDSRYMLPLLFPSDPRMLAALPQKHFFSDEEKRDKRNTKIVESTRAAPWRFRNKKLREVGVGALQWVDGFRSAARWVRPINLDDEEDSPHPPAYTSDDTLAEEQPILGIDTDVTPLTRQPSTSVRKGRHSGGTPIDHTHDDKTPEPPSYYGDLDLHNPFPHDQAGTHDAKHDYAGPSEPTRPPFFREPSSDNTLAPVPNDYNYHSSTSSKHVDDSQASLVYNAADIDRSSRYQDLEYAEPAQADMDRSTEKKSGMASFFAKGKYPLQQRIEDKKRGIGGQKYPFVVWTLTTVMIGVFIYELVVNSRAQGTPVSMKPVINPMLGPSSSALINLGARFPPCMKLVDAVPPSTNFGFPIFLHAGFVHILLNMLAQLTLSAQIEREMGSSAFLITYFAAGIFGNVLGGNFALVGLPSIGASGAIFGTVAVTWVDLFAHWKYQYRPVRKLMFMTIELLIGIAVGFIPYVDNFAHLGGFLMGLLVGTTFYPVISITKRHKLIMWFFRIVAIPLAVILFVVLIRNFYTSDPYAALAVVAGVARNLVFDWSDPTRCGQLLNRGSWLDSGFRNWQPNGCMLYHYNTPQATVCLDSKPVIFIGDSVTRALFFQLAHILDPSLPAAANDGEKHVDHILTTKNGSEVSFFWDPFLNSTHTFDLVQSARDDVHRPALLVLGSGLWYLRYSNSSGGLPAWEANMEHILAEVAKSPVKPADNVVILPVEQVVPSKLNQDRADSLRLSDIDAMNSDLSHRINPSSSGLLFSGKPAYPVSLPLVFNELLAPSETDDGLHFSELVVKTQATILLNLRCSKKSFWAKDAQRPALVFSVGVALVFFADRSGLWLKEQKQFNAWTFSFLSLVALLVGFATIKRSDKDLGFLNREQTDEWKGWMQTSYLFMTGYGHTTFYLRKADFGFLRIAQVMVRLNLLTLVLAYTMNTDYISYYFSPLVSMWFLIIYATMFVGSQFNDRTPFILGKIVISAGLFTWFMKEQWLLEMLFTFLRRVFGIHWSAREWNFRVTLDLWIVYAGMLAAIAVIKIRDHRLTDHARWVLATRIAIALSALCIVWFFVFELLQASKFTYNLWHPYMSWIPVLSFVVLRNASVILRSASSSAFAFIGRCSLETFIIQYHLWLAGDTKGVLLVIPGTPWRPVNFVLSTIMFIYVSDQMAHATTTITSWICGGAAKASLPLPATSSGTATTSLSSTRRDPDMSRSNEDATEAIPLVTGSPNPKDDARGPEPDTPVRSRRWVDRLAEGSAPPPRTPGFRIWYGEDTGLGVKTKLLIGVGVMWVVNLLWPY
ncbi:hypothetical protein DXG01_000285 [Tephrocybe rancida]|nr:hypothetical protein DXG01_000285 [Tephrocybe rancida]